MGQAPIKETLQRMERLMYGYNYEVSFGADVLEQAHSLEQVKQAIQAVYPETVPEEVPLTLIGEGDFRESLQEYLDYRGDAGAGLTLTPARGGAGERARAILCVHQNVSHRKDPNLYLPTRTGAALLLRILVLWIHPAE